MKLHFHLYGFHDYFRAQSSQVNGSCLYMFFQFIKVLQKEMDAVEKEKDKFISDFYEAGFYILFLLFN